MSKLGYISQSYGKEFKISVANTYSYNILSGNNLPVNTIIVSSNIDDDGNDTGTYSLLVTDYMGSPIRLTYTIKEGNGLHYSNDTDYLSLNIDNDTIINDNELKFNINNHLSDYFNINDNVISLNMDRFPDSSKNKFGISSIDDKTIQVDESMIYVNTYNLQFSNDSTQTYGIAIGDGESIFIENGYIYLNTDSFKKSDTNDYGFIKVDGNTIKSDEGVISVNTFNLSKASSIEYGISRPDMKTIVFDKNGSITVNENNLLIASNERYGVSKIDSNTIGIKDNSIYIKSYEYVNSYIKEYKEIYNKFNDKINELNSYLSNGNLLVKDKDIKLFTINESSAVELNKPKYDEEVVKMPQQYVSAKFDIISTCDFILNIDFEDGTNELPAVSLVEIDYGGKIMNLNDIYKSTEGEKTNLTLKFKALNFRNSTKGESLLTSIKITISNVEDHNRNRSEKFSILRYNSLYKEEINTEVLVNNSKDYKMIVTDLQWSIAE